jgi:hypothetical protein
MRLTRLFLGICALAGGCAHTEFNGQAALPKGGPAQIVDKAPARAHRAIGRIKVEKVIGETLETMLARLGDEGGKRGCDVVVCDVNHALVDGVSTDDTTGVRYFSDANGVRVPDGVFGECDVFQ